MRGGRKVGWQRVAIRDAAGPGKRGGQQSLPSPAARNPLAAPRSLASLAVCCQPAALGVVPAVGWALDWVGAGRAQSLQAGGDSSERSSGLPRLGRARRGSAAPAPPLLPPALRQEPQRHVDGSPQAPARAGCVCVCACVCWPSRPCVATARLGLPAWRLAGSPSAARFAPSLDRGLGSGVAPPQPPSSAGVQRGA